MIPILVKKQYILMGIVDMKSKQEDRTPKS